MSAVRPRHRTDAVRAAVVVILALSALGMAAPAGAHATLVETWPAEGAVVEGDGLVLGLAFSEAVAPAPRGLSLEGPDGSRDRSMAWSQPAPDVVTIEVPAALASGSHVLHWRVTSLDGHMVAGVLAFEVVAPTNELAEPADRPAPASGVVPAHFSTAGVAASAPGPVPTGRTGPHPFVLGLVAALGTAALAALALRSPPAPIHEE